MFWFRENDDPSCCYENKRVYTVQWRRKRSKQSEDKTLVTDNGLCSVWIFQVLDFVFCQLDVNGGYTRFVIRTCNL